jgi:hypothetical protein
LPLRHVDLKWSDGSGRSAFMGGVSPVLYRLVVPARPVKISTGVQNLGGCANFHHFLWKLKNSISASKCPITAPKIRTWSQLLSKFSYHTHSLQNGGHPRLWVRLPKSVHNPLGGRGGGGGNGTQASCPCYHIWRGSERGGQEERGMSKHVLVLNAAICI